MCTAIAYKGNDLIYGFNLDIDPAVWNFSVRKTRSLFAIGITVGKTTHYVHGVNSLGHFSNVPYMNGERFSAPRGVRKERIDLLSDRYLRGLYTFENVENIIRTKAVCSIPAATMHSLVGNEKGDFLIIEPGLGAKKVEENFAALTNFPVLTQLPDYMNPFYGKDRYDRAYAVLSKAGAEFSAADALELLHETRQEGQWGTKVTFVYSANANSVTYYLNGDIAHAEVHGFELNEGGYL